MPGYDGTGPRGKGPGTGRGRGICTGFSALCNPKRPPGKIILSFTAAVTGVVIQDALNPDGLIRKLIRLFGTRISGFLGARESDSVKTVRTVDAEVLPDARKK